MLISTVKSKSEIISLFSSVSSDSLLFTISLNVFTESSLLTSTICSPSDNCAVSIFAPTASIFSAGITNVAFACIFLPEESPMLITDE